MSAFLPTGKFKWLSSSEIASFNVRTIADDSDIGYILEVDLIYPESIHQKTDDLPLAPEHLCVSYEMLSNYQKKLLQSLNIKFLNGIKKLVPNLFNKEKYVVHYRNLKYYLKQGLILKKVHRVLSFRQTPWLRDYISFNNDRRRESCNDFDKSFFKLMNNSFYGKTCENVRKRINVKTALSQTQCQRYMSSASLDISSA